MLNNIVVSSQLLDFFIKVKIYESTILVYFRM
nr:MAG TPA: hypothetical protein [Caudoviricetes sp.]